MRVCVNLKNKKGHLSCEIEKNNRKSQLASRVWYLGNVFHGAVETMVSPRTDGAANPQFDSGVSSQFCMKYKCIITGIPGGGKGG